MVFPAERTHFFQVSIKLAHPFPAPELRTRILRTLKGFFWIIKCAEIAARPGCRTIEMIGGSSASYLARTPCVPLFCTLFHRDGNRRAFRLPGEGGDHFHCTVDPSPGHIRCRWKHAQGHHKMCRDCAKCVPVFGAGCRGATKEGYSGSET